jgi:hypothetical protein
MFLIKNSIEDGNPMIGFGKGWDAFNGSLGSSVGSDVREKLMSQRVGVICLRTICLVIISVTLTLF